MTLAWAFNDLLSGPVPDDIAQAVREKIQKAVQPPDEPPPPQWHGWQRDLQLIQAYAGRIRQAFDQAITQIGQLISDWWEGTLTATLRGLVDAAREILATHLGRVLRGLWTEAWHLGDTAANAAMARLGDVDWGDWEPGDPRAARLIGSGSRLQALLDSYGIRTIKSVADTNMDRLAEEIGNAVAEGDSAASLARRLPAILQVPSRAEMIAQTEVARAVSAATLSRYTQSGVNRKEWAVAPDERVCVTCRGNEAAGDIPTSQAFPSGVLAPPGHPRCRCALLPAEFMGISLDDPETVQSDAVALKNFNVNEPRGFHGRWVRTNFSDWSPAELTELDKAVSSDETERDKALEAIITRQRFDMPAQHGNLDEVSAAGGVRIWRGAEDPAVTRDYLESESPRQGHGYYGNGTYFTRTEREATGYARGNRDAVIAAVLHPGARVASERDLSIEHQNDLRKLRPGDPGHKVLSDLGRYAAMRGYDAIDVPGLGYLNVLNRGALVIEQARKIASPEIAKVGPKGYVHGWIKVGGTGELHEYQVPRAAIIGIGHADEGEVFFRTSAAKLLAADLIKVGPEGYIHGYICVRPPCGKEPGTIKPEELWFRKADGAVIHTPSGYKVGSFTRGDDKAKTFTITHHDGSQVYSGSKKGEAQVAIAAHHNAKSGTAPQAVPDLPGLRGDDAISEVRKAESQLTPEQARILGDYTQFSGELNRYLNDPAAGRPGKLSSETPESLDHKAAVLKEAIASSRGISQPVVLIRGTQGASQLFGEPGSKIGHESISKGFMSASSDQSVAERFAAGSNGALVHISLPAGTKAITGSAAEKEVILPPGTRFKITHDGFTTADRYGTDYKVRDIHLEVVPSEPVPEPKPAPAPGLKKPEPKAPESETVVSESTAPIAADPPDWLQQGYNRYAELTDEIEKERDPQGIFGFTARGKELREEQQHLLDGNPWLDEGDPGRYGISDQARRAGFTEGTQQRGLLLGINRQHRAHLAAENGLTPEEGDKQMVRELKKMLAGRRVAIRVTSTNLAKILDSGVFKTQFETDRSKGLKSNETRASLESVQFGYDPETTDPAMRPIYAYMDEGYDRPAGSGTKFLGDFGTDDLTMFGPVQVVLKDKVKARTTFNVGDSMDNKYSSLPSRVSDPQPYSYAAFGKKDGGMVNPGVLKSMNRDYNGGKFRQQSFVEAQIHSPDGKQRPLTTDDIDHVIFPATPPAALRSQLAAKNIPWSVSSAKILAKSGTPADKAHAIAVYRQGLEQARERLQWLQSYGDEYRQKYGKEWSGLEDVPKIQAAADKLQADISLLESTS